MSPEDPDPMIGPAHGPLGQRLVLNVAANVMGRSISILVWLALTPFVLRSLGAEAFGFWSLISTLAGLSLTLDLGLSSSVTRYIAEYRASAQESRMARTLTVALIASAVLGVMWIVAVLAFGDRLLDFAKVHAEARREAGLTLIWMGAAFAINLMAQVVTAVIAGLHRIDLASRNLLLTTLLQLALIAASLVRGGGVVGLAVASTASAVAAVILAAVTLRALWPSVRLSLGNAGGKSDWALGQFGLALQLVSLGVLVLYQLPKLFYAHFLTLGAVGDYELGWRVAFSAWSIPTLLLPPLLPAAAHLAVVEDRVRLLELYRRSTRYLLAIALPLAGGMVALSQPLFTAWLGPGHGAVAQANLAIVGLLGFNVLTSPGCLIARGLGRPWWEAGYLAVACLVQLLLGVLWVPRFGFQGGLLAMAVAGFTGSVLFLLLFHRHLQEPLGRFLGRNAFIPMLAAVLGGAAGWWVSGAAGSNVDTWPRMRALMALLLGGSTSAIVSVCVLFVSRFLTWTEVRGLLRLARTPAHSTAVAE